jgi:hypothetical protein
MAITKQIKSLEHIQSYVNKIDIATRTLPASIQKNDILLSLTTIKISAVSLSHKISNP